MYTFWLWGVYPDLLHIVDLQIAHDLICSTLLEMFESPGSSRDRQLQELCHRYESWCKTERTMARLFCILVSLVLIDLPSMGFFVCDPNLGNWAKIYSLIMYHLLAGFFAVFWDMDFTLDSPNLDCFIGIWWRNSICVPSKSKIVHCQSAFSWWNILCCCISENIERGRSPHFPLLAFWGSFWMHGWLVASAVSQWKNASIDVMFLL